jgi:hypothetical protein
MVDEACKKKKKRKNIACIYIYSKFLCTFLSLLFSEVTGKVSLVLTRISFLLFSSPFQSRVIIIESVLLVHQPVIFVILCISQLICVCPYILHLCEFKPTFSNPILKHIRIYKIIKF